MNNRGIYVLIVIGVIVLAIIAVVAFTNGGNNTEQNGDGNEAENGDLALTETYTNDDIGFTVPIPSGADVQQEQTQRYRIRYLGPESEEATEITDGFTFTITANDPLGSTIENYVEEQTAGPQANLLSGPAAVTFGTHQGYQFTVQGPLNSTTRYVFPLDEAAYDISVFVADPGNRGYTEIVNEMLRRMTFFPSALTAPLVSEIELAFLEEPAPSEDPEEGCDAVVYETFEIGPTRAPLTAALEELFSLESETVRGHRNFIARTNDTLQFNRVTVQNGVASVYLSGNLSGLAGVCDNPRARTQVVETALQFETVNDVDIYLNGEEVSLVPSGQGEEEFVPVENFEN